MGARREARVALAAAGLRPQKRWGQHFLCDPSVAQRIVDAAALAPGAAVLEIGPGLGALTDALAARAGRLYMVEIDRGLAARLADRHAADPHVEVLVGDVLELPLDTLIAEPEATVVANLPYNISSPVLFRLLELRARFPRAVLMLQRELAERLAAGPGDEARGVLSVLVQTWAEVRVAFRVSRRSFVPPPRVDSAVAVLRFSTAPRVALDDPIFYAAVVRAAFGQRRKMLRNALRALAATRGLDPAALEARCARAGVDARARAETLGLEDFARLAAALAR
jgi:16S rRNA (adenine1518-N6/adenine1519-N6)-dimethyltransferase